MLYKVMANKVVRENAKLMVDDLKSRWGAADKEQKGYENRINFLYDKKELGISQEKSKQSIYQRIQNLKAKIAAKENSKEDLGVQIKAEQIKGWKQVFTDEKSKSSKRDFIDSLEESQDRDDQELKLKNLENKDFDPSELDANPFQKDIKTQANQAQKENRKKIYA
jgi:hypothetical protein